MIDQRAIWTPKTGTILWRVLGLLLLSLLWLRGHSSEIGVVLLLFLSIMALARWRMLLPGWTVVLDQVACIISIPFWPHASYGFAIPIFEAALVGKPLLTIPGLIFIIFYVPVSIPLTSVLLQGGLSGWIIRGWTRETKLYREEADQQRKDRYELESLKGELLMANVQAARMAEMAERNRIAQKLHDDVGHEITAAVLAMQAFEQLWKEENSLATEMFEQAQKRLNNSALYLRETVHNMKPSNPIGVERLEEICATFNACPIDLQIYGDTSSVPAYLWSILEPCLKEALTNVMRHTTATKVEVSLDVNPHILRLSVFNDGEESDSKESGIGIRNLRQRAKAVGGSVSIDTTEGFKLVCVLPMNKGGNERENSNSR